MPRWVPRVGGLARLLGQGVDPQPRWPNTQGLVRHAVFDQAVGTWSSVSGNGTASAEAVWTRIGSKALRVTATTAGAQGRYNHSLFSSTNFTSSAGDYLWYELHMYVNGAAGSLSGITLDFLSGNGANMNHVDVQGGAAVRNGWVHLRDRIDSYVNSGLGAFNAAAVTGLGVRFTSGSIGDYLTLAHARFYRSPGVGGKAQLAFILDDSLSQHVAMANAINERGWPVALAVIGNGVAGGKGGGYLTPAQLRSLVRAGNLAVNHTWDHDPAPYNWAHPTNVSRDTRVDQILRCTEYLHELGVGEGARIFAAPFGLGNSVATEVPQDDLDAIIGAHCDVVLNTHPTRSAWAASPHLASTNKHLPAPLQSRDVVERSIADTEFTAAAVQAVAANKQTALVMLHQLDSGGYLTTAQLKTALDEVAAQEAAGALKVHRLDQVLAN